MKVEFSVAGISFRPNAAQLRPAGPVQIVPDPTNKFDPMALAVMWGAEHIGYIPGPKNKATPTLQADMHALLTAGTPFIAEVTSYRYRDGENWNDNHQGKLGCVNVLISTDMEQSSVIVKDGREYQRISSLVKVFHPDGIDGLMNWAIRKFRTPEAYQQFMDNVASEGTAMHAALETFFRSGERNPELPTGLDEFLSLHAIAPMEFETRVFDDATGMSGQFDMFAMVNDEATVVDWKSAKSVRIGHRLQACWYANRKAIETGRPVRAMVVAWGAEPYQVWHGTAEQVEVGAAIVDKLIACVNWTAKLS